MLEVWNDLTDAQKNEIGKLPTTYTRSVMDYSNHLNREIEQRIKLLGPPMPGYLWTYRQTFEKGKFTNPFIKGTIEIYQISEAEFKATYSGYQYKD
jgi:hypothetical protein